MMSLSQMILPVTKARGEVNKIYGRTFIDPKTLPCTREFSDQEIKVWLEEDRLVGKSDDTDDGAG
jgi:hypothetical protein